MHRQTRADPGSFAEGAHKIGLDPRSRYLLGYVPTTKRATAAIIASAIHRIKVKVALHSAILIDPEIMNGIPYFCGTRVPFENSIDYLEADIPSMSS